MIEVSKNKRFKVCLKIIENDKLVKKFSIMTGKSEVDIENQLFIKYGKLNYYRSKLDEDHIGPGILYINRIEEIKDGEITT